MNRYLSVMVTLPRILREEEAEDYCTGPVPFADLKTNWGLEPYAKRPRLTTYDRCDIDDAIDRRNTHWQRRQGVFDRGCDADTLRERKR